MERLAQRLARTEVVLSRSLQNYFLDDRSLATPIDEDEDLIQRIDLIVKNIEMLAQRIVIKSLDTQKGG